MKIINSKIDVQSAIKEYAEKESVLIENFFSEEYAKTIYNFFNHVPASWWNVVSFPSSLSINMESRVRNDPSELSQNTIHKNFIIASDAFANGKSSYHYLRSDIHQTGCGCFECDLKKNMSDEILNFVNVVTKEKCTELMDSYLIKYAEGCFVSPHRELAIGDVSVRLEMTKEWSVHQGGLTNILSKDKKEILSSLPPRFNSITIHKGREDKSQMKFISPVIAKTPNSRYEYVAYYVKKNVNK
jgi:hypothetical protein